MKTVVISGILAFLAVQALGQSGCDTPGQTPATAFPVCGTTVFSQSEVPACENHLIPVSGCSFDNTQYSDQSPFWYKFTCFKTGTLGFLIDPVNNGDDYDWQLFDVTGRDPEAVYTDPSLFVAGNWSGESGNTGTSSSANSILVCATLQYGPYRPLYSQMPHLVQGHNYLLLVSHFSGSTQSGYQLSFKGGTAVITDTTAPRLKQAVAVCDGRSVTIHLNKSMKCRSLAGDGSDFRLLGTDIKVDSAYSATCKDGFDMEELTLVLDGKLAPGQYGVAIQKGRDDNTLLDNCDNAIPEDDTLAFVLQAPHPVPMDSVTKLTCRPQSITVVFAEPLRCSSIAADGSDFRIVNTRTGQSLAITGASGVDCTNSLSRSVTIDLAAPIYQQDIYQLRLQPGGDGNSVVSECEVESEPQTIVFESYDTVSAVIESQLDYSCNRVEVALHNPGDNGINSWNWQMTPGTDSDSAGLAFVDTTFQPRTVQLKVSNGVCSDQQQMTLSFDQDYYLQAGFTEPPFVCPQDEVQFVDTSVGGNIMRWNWTFGNGQTNATQAPEPQHYPVGVHTETYPVRLIVSNSRGCRDTMQQEIKVINTCNVYVPTAFSPNDDGNNDYLYPLNAYLAEKLQFRVYNRYGELLFETHDWTRGWDGTFKSKPQPTGSYVWMLRFVNSRTGQKVFRKGAALLIR